MSRSRRCGASCRGRGRGGRPPIASQSWRARRRTPLEVQGRVRFASRPVAHNPRDPLSRSRILMVDAAARQAGVTARKSTGGKAPSKQLATKAARERRAPRCRHCRYPGAQHWAPAAPAARRLLAAAAAATGAVHRHGARGGGGRPDAWRAARPPRRASYQKSTAANLLLSLRAPPGRPRDACTSRATSATSSRRRSSPSRRRREPVPRRPLRGHRPVRDPRQARHDHAEGAPPSAASAASACERLGSMQPAYQHAGAVPAGAMDRYVSLLCSAAKCINISSVGDPLRRDFRRSSGVSALLIGMAMHGGRRAQRRRRARSPWRRAASRTRNCFGP